MRPNSESVTEFAMRKLICIFQKGEFVKKYVAEQCGSYFQGGLCFLLFREIAAGRELKSFYCANVDSPAAQNTQF